MIVDNFNVQRTRRTFGPPETNPPLIVDPNGELASAVALERFQPVPRQCREISETCRCFEPIETHFGLPGKAGEFPYTLPGGKPRRRLASIADDH
jgi:hypothetical protein